MKKVVFASAIFSTIVSVGIVFSNPQTIQANSKFDIADATFGVIPEEFKNNVNIRPSTNLLSFADTVEDAMPAVVNISTTQNVEVPNNPFEELLRKELPQGGQFDFFREFFDRDLGNENEEHRTRKATSLGSGFIIDPSGFVVTNNHVIAEADEINVLISDHGEEKTYKAELVGSDKKTDLAVLKIKGKMPFPYLKFGSSNHSRVGDWIITIGNPFGLGGTVTTGIISAKARFIPGQFDDFIQTDASINRGNSGGPMINLKGEVIGVNSVIISPSGGNVGIGLAIPSSTAQPIVKQLIEKGAITRGWLGVKIQPVNEDIAKNLGLPDTKGALVAEVMKGSPAEKAKIKIGDVILKFDGKAISSMQKLPRIVAETTVNKKVNIEVVRDSKKLVLDMVVEKSPDQAEETKKLKAENDDKSPAGISTILGMRVEDITKLNIQKYKLDKDKKGALVTKVNRNSPAQDVGIMAGDLIVRFNNAKIQDVAGLEKALKAAKSAGAKNGVMLISRNGNNQFIVIEFE